MVRAPDSHLVDLGFIPQVESYQKTLKMVFTASLLGVQHIGIVWKTSRQACLLCSWARHLTGRLHLQVANRWRGQAVYPSWWPSLTKDMQTEHEFIRIYKANTAAEDRKAMPGVFSKDQTTYSPSETERGTY